MKIHNPPMQFKEGCDAEWATGLAKNQDGYGQGIYRYASEWATRMEAELAKGAKLEDIAKKTSHEADNEGITGCMGPLLPFGEKPVSMVGSW